MRLIVVVTARIYLILKRRFFSGIPRNSLCQWLRGRICRRGTYLSYLNSDLSVSLLRSGKVSTRDGGGGCGDREEKKENCVSFLVGYPVTSGTRTGRVSAVA